MTRQATPRHRATLPRNPVGRSCLLGWRETTERAATSGATTFPHYQARLPPQLFPSRSSRGSPREAARRETGGATAQTTRDETAGATARRSKPRHPAAAAAAPSRGDVEPAASGASGPRPVSLRTAGLLRPLKSTTAIAATTLPRRHRLHRLPQIGAARATAAHFPCDCRRRCQWYRCVAAATHSRSHLPPQKPPHA